MKLSHSLSTKLKGHQKKYHSILHQLPEDNSTASLQSIQNEKGLIDLELENDLVRVGSEVRGGLITALIKHAFELTGFCSFSFSALLFFLYLFYCFFDFRLFYFSFLL